MLIKITGATGYLGTLISFQLKKQGHEVSDIKREILYGSVEILKDEIRNCDVLINLAGAPILQRWTSRNRKSIYDSRIKTTKNLVSAINKLPKNEQPKKFISTSAIGIYQTGTLHTEFSTNFDMHKHF